MLAYDNILYTSLMWHLLSLQTVEMPLCKCLSILWRPTQCRGTTCLPLRLWPCPKTNRARAKWVCQIPWVSSSTSAHLLHIMEFLEHTLTSRRSCIGSFQTTRNIIVLLLWQTLLSKQYLFINCKGTMGFWAVFGGRLEVVYRRKWFKGVRVSIVHATEFLNDCRTSIESRFAISRSVTEVVA